ncbi:MAG: hypothetical protein IJS08_05645 [Victivallales bacterium]|nr:hypothetical protein [Victivallales bacterium]
MNEHTIQTVTGAVSAASCGMVLSHEHLFIDLSNQAAPGALERALSPDDRPALMQDPYSMRDNLAVDDYAGAIAECAELKRLGCDTIVDCTTAQIGCDARLLRKLAQDTGMNIVMGCGYYTGDTHDEAFLNMSEEDAAEAILHDCRDGVCEGICAGIIGEIGTSKVLLPSERKALLAAAKAQLASGLAVQVHIYPWCTNGLEATEILTRNGVAPSRIVICHSDVEPNRDYILSLLKLGVYVELDNFGKEFTPAPGGFAAGRFISDVERVELAAWIIKNGYEKQLLLTNDICLKCLLMKHGGAGYRHIFADIMPMLVAQGIPSDLVTELVLRENPLRMLTGEL